MPDWEEIAGRHNEANLRIALWTLVFTQVVTAIALLAHLGR